MYVAARNGGLGVCLIHNCNVWPASTTTTKAATTSNIATNPHTHKHINARALVLYSVCTGAYTGFPSTLAWPSRASVPTPGRSCTVGATRWLGTWRTTGPRCRRRCSRTGWRSTCTTSRCTAPYGRLGLRFSSLGELILCHIPQNKKLFA